jgi:PAS domain S-box-containing protein
MTRPIQLVPLFGFLIALGLILGQQWLSLRTSLRMGAASEMVSFTHEARSARILLRSDVLGVEIGERSYVLTGQDVFLEMFEESVTRTHESFRRLGELTRDEEQRRNLAALEPLIAARIELARHKVDLCKAGRPDLATQEVATLEGKRLTDLIRERLDVMDARSQVLLELRAAAAEREARRAQIIMALGTVVSVGLLIAVFALVLRENRRRRSTEHQLRVHGDELEARVLARTQSLQLSEARLSLALQVSEIGAWRLALGDHSAHRTPLHDRIFGYQVPLPTWTHEMFLEHVLPEERGAVDRAFRQCMEEESELKLECRIRRADGEVRWILVGGGIERDARGIAVAVAGIVQDVTERKAGEAAMRRLNSELDERVRQRTRELEEANKDLESFSYSVSHDLRAPLRHVQGYVEMLERAAGDGLSEKARHYMSTIARASQEMGRLIDGLLEFARMGRVSLRLEPVGMNELVISAIQDLELATRDRSVEWRVGPLPEVLGDQALLKQVLANLLGNAVKYSRHREHAVITIGSEGLQDGRVTLHVRDNGAGFDMRYADKLFGVFQRLHRADEFEGTGIGLATVQRIVLRHGGRAWAEGRIGEGATFYITLMPAPGTAGSDEATWDR